MNFVYSIAFSFTFFLFSSNQSSATDISQNSNFQITIFNDTSDSLSVEKVKNLLKTNRKLFVPSVLFTQPFNPHSTYWLYIQAKDSISKEQYVLSFHNWVSLVEVYPYPYTTISGYGGRLVSGKLKDLPGCNIILKPGINSYLIKVQNRIYAVASAKNFEIIPIQVFYSRLGKIDLIHGLLLGAFMLMLIYNLVFFFFAHSRLYLYYVIYILLNTLFLLFTYNYSESFLFPNNFRLNHVLLSSQIIGTFFYTMFLRTALLSHCTKYTPAVDRKVILPLAYIMLACNIVIGVIAFFRMDIYMVAQGITNFINTLIALGAFIYSYKHADRFMRILIAGSVIVVAFGYVNIVKLFFYLGSFNMYYELGVLIELLIFTYALNKLHFEEKYYVELSKRQLEKELDEKKRELVYKAIQLSAKEEVIASIKESMKEIKTTEVSSNSSVVDILWNNPGEENLWKEFEVHFNETHPGFYKTLANNHPDLTSNEVRLCSFLKLNLTTKEIALITKKSPRSIEVMRSRIRQKMDIDRDDSLNHVLTQLQ